MSAHDIHINKSTVFYAEPGLLIPYSKSRLLPLEQLEFGFYILGYLRYKFVMLDRQLTQQLNLINSNNKSIEFIMKK